MSEMEDYVMCGSDIAKLEPTFELRWNVSPTPGDPDTLEQRWVARTKMQDGGMWEEERWREVPRFVEKF